MSKQILVLNGPNLGRLGRREPQIYGTTTHDDLAARLIEYGRELGLDVEVRQTDSEERMMGGFIRPLMTGPRSSLIRRLGATTTSLLPMPSSSWWRLVLRSISLTSQPGRSSVTTVWCRRMSPGRSPGWD
ncbi:3-dehydroquinate dehydratase II [Cutibacterium acnes JCM 18918]|nr:3-dehydroquinate dehydratase II [Cutibacterium acnes JCM 18918]